MTNEEFETKLGEKLDALTKRLMATARVESENDPILASAACAQVIGYLMAVAHTAEEGREMLLAAIRVCHKRAISAMESTELFGFKTRSARKTFIDDCKKMDPKAEFVTSQDRSQKAGWLVGVRASEPAPKLNK